MKTKIRLNCFETNSSSCHSCVITTEEEREKWKKGELLFCYDSFSTLEEVKEEYNKYKAEGGFEDWLYDEDYKNYDDWCTYYEDRCEFDTETREINGVKVFVDCAYGYDG